MGETRSKRERAL